jgi:NADH-quinone oxidoreductase subunit A
MLKGRHQAAFCFCRNRSRRRFIHHAQQCHRGPKLRLPPPSTVVPKPWERLAMKARLRYHGAQRRTVLPSVNRGSMPDLLNEYLPIIVFMAIAAAIGLALLVAPVLIAVRHPDPEKLSAYECGFNAFDDARMKFDVRFYLVSILFIIFDLEVAFLFPWAISLKAIGATGFWSMVIFLAVLTIGFTYEWRKGALEWD